MIEHLFSKGKSASAFPLKMIYDFVQEETFSLRAGVTASSRKFKKAVDRNRVKRVMREAYRLQKIPLQKLLMTEGQSMALFFIYIGKEMPVYKEVHDKMGVLLQKLTREIIHRKLVG